MLIGSLRSSSRRDLCCDPKEDSENATAPSSFPQTRLLRRTSVNSAGLISRSLLVTSGEKFFFFFVLMASCLYE